MITNRLFLVALTCVVCAYTPANAQLRPLDPVDFRSFHGEPVHVQIGFGVYFDQTASLAGTRGRLWEIGDVKTSVRTGRMVLELSGTMQRVFDDEIVLREPYGGARQPPPDGRRRDVGDYRVSTALRLTPVERTLQIALRFGTRLPTTDNRVGLDRDATDFFATIAARRPFGLVSFGAEAGLGIHGTRQNDYEQSDVLVYAVTTELAAGALTPFATILGQQDFHEWAVRGNEDLSELRVGLRAGARHWLSAAWIHGFSDWSPSGGLQMSAGMSFGGR